MSEGATGAAYAAGRAEAIAEDAHENAGEAVEAAEEAQETAEAAVDVASSASETAWDARFAVDELREQVTQGFTALGARIDELVEGMAQPTSGSPAGDGDQAAKAPAKKAPAKPADDAAPKGKTSGWWAR
ncbi:MAG: hypothetical protein A2Y78_10175 [Acidobacteria bacterium RBG_13_68_16]|nr:MAG: hypothetical protein A2Y78_10175 [Acidobacteria bacterium RBG_13_68_16]